MYEENNNYINNQTSGRITDTPIIKGYSDTYYPEYDDFDKEYHYVDSPQSGIYDKPITKGYTFSESDLAEIKRQEEMAEFYAAFAKRQEEQKKAATFNEKPPIYKLRKCLLQTAGYLQGRPETFDAGIKVGRALNELDKGNVSYLYGVYDELMNLSLEYAPAVEYYIQLTKEVERLYDKINGINQEQQNIGDSYNIKKEKYKRASFFNQLKEKTKSLIGGR